MDKKTKPTAAQELSRTKRDLAALRERYVNLYDLAPVGLFTLSATGRILEANLTVAAMLGVEKDLLLKRPLGAFVDPEDRGAFRRTFRKFPSKEAPPYFELRMRRAAAPFWARLERTLGHDSRGALLYRVVMSDVSERVRTQTDLLRLRAAVDQAHDGLAIADMEGRLRFVNRAWGKMHGYAPDEMTGQPMEISHTPEQMERDVLPFNKKVLGEGSWAGEVGHVRRDGTTFTCWMSTVLLHDAEGKVTGLVGLADDITERRKSEEAFARMLAEREAILKSIPDLFYRLDADMRLQDWNQVFERVSGYSPQELKGMHALKLAGSDEKIAAEGLKTALEKGLNYRTTRLLTKRGEEIPIFWSAAALRDKDGVLLGLVGIGRDLTVK
ncbi:MAG: PAS domain S-box protein [Elusimicrobia bacterium]|nr:PAS domain S-box protein [Elusimicrobiota bacterium]